MSLIFFYLITLFSFINGQAPSPQCIANPPTPTGPCPIATNAAVFNSGELSPLLTTDLEVWCSHPFTTQWSNFSNTINIGTLQTSKQKIVFGTTSGGGASRVTGSTMDSFSGLWTVMYSSTCAGVSGSACSYSSPYTGFLNCACVQQGNIPVTSAPTPGSTLGYQRTAAPSSTSLDAFYPNMIGHYVYHFECRGSASTSQAYIELVDVASGLADRRALKDASIAVPLSITFVKTYNATSSLSGVRLRCVSCDLGSSTAPLCSFTAYKQG